MACIHQAGHDGQEKREESETDQGVQADQQLHVREPVA
jgi:hypothetical protein